MEKVRILNVCYGARESAINYMLASSTEYEVKLYLVDKQLNPLNLRLAKEGGGVHVVDPSLSIEGIVRFAKKYKTKIDFAICPNEEPIIKGIRNKLYWELGIPTLCPIMEFALEGSKIKQRQLLDEIATETNPKFKIFDPAYYESKGKNFGDLLKGADEWIDELGGVGGCVVKPDGSGYGKGVVVGNEHIFTKEDAHDHIDREHKTIIEEKLEGEESSFQAYCDGLHLVPLPDTRDYKRAKDGDVGPNTGGMGSYSDKEEYLPFTSKADRTEEVEIAEKLLHYFKNKFNNNGRNYNLLGMPFYIAFMHTAEGPKILEINSREGDPESLCTLHRLDEDLVGIYYRIIEGNLNSIKLNNKAVVTTYLVPDIYPEKDSKRRKLSLDAAEQLVKKYTVSKNGLLGVYPASVELRDSGIYSLSSRTVAAVGVADEIEAAREISLTGVRTIENEGFRYRSDIASREHIRKSIEHMEKIRH